ncbi:carbamate kinase [Entomoplasma freundtii]|uniref:Carbamate kinase n=1 Tax=Entomoplasma freundtii TaxID=74700 RepID=A0A2K8NQH8_9MOLU|nr:carbamate kinase [Entomoplasma freundtii]ATZ16079.1 carbamate kinase [Entomoplasma freundtii]TDY57019.1 carbamate kinase [Entomoplasma freundtii]
MGKIVVAIGGNALGNNPDDQRRIVKNTAKYLGELIEKKNDIIIVHGNGPQVGMINSAFDLAHQNDAKIPLMDFPECGALSEGYIGYHLQQALDNELTTRNLKKNVATIVTQTLVSESDPAFKNPTKPIGSFLSEGEAQTLAKKYNWTVKEDAGRGWRRVVASPKPLGLVELDIVKTLIANHDVPICAGGGGVPVVKKDGVLHGVPAVIDKDLAAAKLGDLVQTDILLVLTAVDYVWLNYNQPDAKSLKTMTVSEAEKYISENQFAAGSMLPKIEAALTFVKGHDKRIAYIGSLDKVDAILNGDSGTKIIN